MKKPSNQSASQRLGVPERVRIAAKILMTAQAETNDPLMVERALDLAQEVAMRQRLNCGDRERAMVEDLLLRPNSAILE